MKFGIFLTNQSTIGVDQKTEFENQLDVVRRVRDFGFDSIWTGQHYLSTGIEMMQPLPFLARIAPEVGDLKVGLGINLLALHNPVEIAENYASLDVICGGNLIFGVGLGYRDEEYAAFGLGKTGRASRFEQNLGALRSLWSEDDSEINLPWCFVKDARPSIRPIQKNLPIWMAANSDSAVQRAARLADAWIINPHATFSTIERQIELFRASRATPATEQPAIREVFCAETREKAIEIARPFLLAKYSSYQSWGQHKALPGEESFDIPFEELLEDRFIVGSPSDCIKELQRWILLGIDHLIIRTHWFGMSTEDSSNSMELIAKFVIPALL